MTKPTQPLHSSTVTLSTQAFLILCRLFDGCYDELKQQAELQAVTEETAQVLLASVERLQAETVPPKQVELSVTTAQSFFLRKLLREMFSRLPQEEQESKNGQWLQEGLQALGG
ncbi:hypothetical protein [Brevibacillus migulae]|uniref:hypothetical protein n=1 Tax=Brevibacillus migulae TaxID=1644114 RepID=UPI00106E6172|nr:hypothetical protein [Brevibacillus migulae]